MLIDSHCHIVDSDKKVWTLFDSLKYKYCVMSAVLSDFDKVSSLASLYRSKVIPAFGIHPWKISHIVTDCKVYFGKCDDFSHALVLIEHELEKYLLQHPESMVGEIGLDQYAKNPETGLIHDFSNQQALFEMQFRLAVRLNRPVSVHCVKCQGWLLEFLMKQKQVPKIMMHSYGGSREMIKQLTRIPMAGDKIFFSFSSIVNSRKSDVAKVIKAVPINRLLIESDVSNIEVVDEELEKTLKMICDSLQVNDILKQIEENQKAFFIDQNMQ